MPELKFTPDPTPEDAAALIAGIERFLFDTAAPPPVEAEAQSGWLRAALAAGVGESDKHALW